MATLFTGQTLAATLQHQSEQAMNWISQLREQNILDDAPGVAQEAVERFSLDPIVLDETAVSATTPSEHRDPNGAYWQIILTVPYSGGGIALFSLRPSSFQISGQPVGSAALNAVMLKVESPRMTAEELNRRGHEALASLRQHVEWVNIDLANARRVLEEQARFAVDERSKSIKARRDAGGDLDFPIGS